MIGRKDNTVSYSNSCNKIIAVISTYSTKKSVTKVANDAVKLKLTACVNIVKISSIYSWKNKTENVQEYMAIFKTTTKNKKKLKNYIRKNHPYEVPEIAEMKINSVNTPYMKWIIGSVL